MNIGQVWSRWQERRWRVHEVRQAIRNGTLSEFHRERHGTFVVDADLNRSEELRVDRLGPGEEDLEDPLPVGDPWRPSRTLGPLP